MIVGRRVVGEIGLRPRMKIMKLKTRGYLSIERTLKIDRFYLLSLAM